MLEVSLQKRVRLAREAYDPATMSSSLRSTHSATPPVGRRHDEAHDLGVIGLDAPEERIIRRLLRVHPKKALANYVTGAACETIAIGSHPATVTIWALASVQRRARRRMSAEACSRVACTL